MKNLAKNTAPSTLKSTSLALLISAALSGNALAASSPELEAMQNELNVMKEKLDLTLDMLNNQGGQSSGHGHGSSGKTTIGGYGELHYNNLNGTGSASDKNQIDFHRFVLFFGHEFSDSIRFFSELELEHSIAGEGQDGEMELEQAYIEFDINDRTRSQAGLFLIPVGIINETHEPPTFYGVERNPIEKNIVPASWWEAGASINGTFAQGWRYDLAITSGLDLNTENKVRSGRQKVSKAEASSPMITGRLKYTGIAGLELATTIATLDDYTQGQGSKNSATLIEAHAVWQRGPFVLRALYATWDLNGKPSGYDEQTGYYVEPSYKLSTKLGVFARYNQYDNQAGSGTPGNTEKTQVDLGLNWWPHEDVVIKVDYQNQDNDNGGDQNGINLGLGYQF